MRIGVENQMTVFRVGMKAICINPNANGEWENDTTGDIISGPTYREVCTVTRIYRSADDDLQVLDFREYAPNAEYDISYFRPVAYPRQSAEHDAALFRPWIEHAVIDEIARKLDEVSR